jgi:CspA family cold shock protein
MSNHRSRKTRGRGFDDEFSEDRGPPSRDAPRFPTPSFPSSSSSLPAGFGPEQAATVKWFNAEKGFGFAELSDGSGDVFLHINALTTAGHATVNPGATLKVRVGQGQKGRQVSEVLSVDDSTAAPQQGRPMAPRAPGAAPVGPRRGPDPGSAVEMAGTVKMYNAIKGFGFVALPEGGKDVFVHASALQRGGMTVLTEGQQVRIDVVQGAKGPEAINVREA